MPTQRIGSEDSATRALLLDTAEKLMVEEGYSAVTKRRVAAEAGVKAPLVYYYFRTMDNVFLAMYNRAVDQTLERMEKALVGGNPLRVLWTFTRDPRHAAMDIELRALANHRKAFRKHMARTLERFRKLQVKHIARYLEERGLGSEKEAALFAFIMTNLSGFLISEKIMGISMGSAQTSAFVERFLRRIEEPGGPGKFVSKVIAQIPSPAARKRQSANRKR